MPTYPWRLRADFWLGRARRYVFVIYFLHLLHEIIQQERLQFYCCLIMNLEFWTNDIVRWLLSCWWTKPTRFCVAQIFQWFFALLTEEKQFMASHCFQIFERVIWFQATVFLLQFQGFERLIHCIFLSLGFVNLDQKIDSFSIFKFLQLEASLAPQHLFMFPFQPRQVFVPLSSL